MDRERSFRVVGIWLVAAFTASVSAVPLLPADHDAIQQQQPEQLRREQEQLDELVRCISLLYTAEPPSVTSDAFGHCLNIRDLSLNGSTPIKPTAQQKLACRNHSRQRLLADIHFRWRTKC